jgi:hypothetical protein
LWRENFFYLIPLFALPVWIAAFGLRFIPEQYRWLSWFTLWWLKPFFDRLCLQVVSARFFTYGNSAENPSGITTGSTAGFRQILRGLWGNLFRSLVGDLSWRRFSPLRGASMPLRLLERSRQYGKRKKTLVSGGLNFCALLSCLGLVLEAVLLGGEVFFALAMLEFFFPNFSFAALNATAAIELFLYAAFCFNYILVESLYVCMGFGLYINSRVEMEGWDIQLLFQKFTAQKSTGGNFAKSLILIFGLLIFVLPLRAEDASDTPNTLKEYFPETFLSLEQDTEKSLEEILSSEDFGGVKTGWQIRFKKEKNDTSYTLPPIAPWIRGIKEILAYILRALVVLAIAGFAVFALIHLYQNRRPPGRRDGGRAYANPLVSSESPEVLFGKAEDFFRRGLFRDAWAACLCGTITAYERDFSLSFPPDATEYGCIDLIHSHLKGQEYFGELVRNWVLLAYGGKDPPEGSFEKALEFGRNVHRSPAFASQAHPGRVSGEAPYA